MRRNDILHLVKDSKPKPPEPEETIASSERHFRKSMKRFLAILVIIAILLAVYFMSTEPSALEGGNIAKWNA